jgi:hypothetical protein
MVFGRMLTLGAIGSSILVVEVDSNSVEISLLRLFFLDRQKQMWLDEKPVGVLLFSSKPVPHANAGFYWFCNGYHIDWQW